MNKAQKITIIITLLLIFIIIIYPPVKGYYHGNKPVAGKRMFLFSLTHPVTGQINIRNLIPELLAIICLGGALTILLGLKKKD